MAKKIYVFTNIIEENNTIIQYFFIYPRFRYVKPGFKVAYTVNKICTTDAPFRETFELIDSLREDNAIAIEMEVSAVFSVAQFRNVQAAALVVISDELRDKQWSKFQRNIFAEIFLAANLEAIQFLGAKE